VIYDISEIIVWGRGLSEDGAGEADGSVDGSVMVGARVF